jgi:hypothetical protein
MKNSTVIDPQVTRENKSTSRIFVYATVVLSILLITLSVFLFLERGSLQTTREAPLLPSSVDVTESDTDEIFTVNHYTFQVKYPSKYLVTSDSMLTSYDSEGGQAPPVLIFTLNSQPLKEDFYFYNLYHNESDFIAIESTRGYRDISDWQNSSDFELISQDVEDYHGYDLERRIVKYTGDTYQTMEAFLLLEDDSSFFFQSRGNIPQEDFDCIVESLKIRALELENL